ncbi:hypothetical protein SCLCIDRAFT_1218360, partial [Scleroderma citrinum Foug A]
VPPYTPLNPTTLQPTCNLHRLTNSLLKSVSPTQVTLHLSPHPLLPAHTSLLHSCALAHRHRYPPLLPMTPYLSTCHPDSTCSASHALTVNSTNTPKSTTPSIPEDTPLDTEPLTQEKLEQLNQETSDPAAKAEKR